MAIELYSADRSCIAFGNVRISDMKEMEYGHLLLNMKLDFLPEGQYAFKLNMHFQDDLGNFVKSIDQTDFIYFEVLNMNQKLVWHPEWWGRFRLDEFLHIG